MTTEPGNPYQPPASRLADSDNVRPLSFWASVWPFAGGCFVGLLALFFVRVLYYDWMEYEPNVHPGIMFFALPVVFPMMLAVVLPVEAALRFLISKPVSKSQAFCVGVVSVSLLSWWAFPPYWYAITVLNPIVLRLLVPDMIKAWRRKTFGT